MKKAVEVLRADTVTKDFISDTEVFADVFNYYIYEGRQVIRPEELTERDSTEIVLPYGSDGKKVPVQRFRDVRKLYTSMTDGKAEYVLYGVENQSDIHYAMPVKSNLYDAMNYAGQVEETARAHRRAMKKAKDEKLKGESETKNPEKSGNSPQKKPDSGEFLGGFWKEDKLIPSVTVTVYFGNEEWDGPLSLFDMMDATDPKLFACMDNYHVRLIAPALMPDSEIEKFQSNLREVLLFIKYSKDKEKLLGILKSNEKRFKEVERRAADVIEVITNQRIKYDEKEEKVDVCQAIEEIIQESEQIGEQRGEKIGALKTAQENARNFYRLGVEVGKIAEGVGYDLDTVREWLGLST